MSDVAGICCGSRAMKKSLMTHLSASEVPELKAKGIIGEGMIPKVDSAVAAIRKRRRESAVRRWPGAAFDPARNFTDAGVGNGGRPMKMEMEGDMKTLKVDRLSDIRKLFQRNVVPT